MDLLLSSLQISLAAAALAPDSQAADNGMGGCGGMADLVTGTTLRCAVYCRAAPSIQSGELKLQLVAHSSCGGGAGGGGVAGGRLDQQSLLLGRGTYDLEGQESWLVEQSIIVLPDSGELAARGFLGGCTRMGQKFLGARVLRSSRS
jgi:hypothetical protein